MSNASFISYRRVPGGFVARAVYQDLERHNLDAFFDVETLNQGGFRDVIALEIRRRPYFLPILTPGTLERCADPGDVLFEEFKTADAFMRRIVPLTTTEFNRADIEKYLPSPFAKKFGALNTVTLDHEYFGASMEKLRSRFLIDVAVQAVSIDEAAARKSKELLDKANKQPTINRDVLLAQRHFERAFNAVDATPRVAVAEFTAGAELLKGATGAKSFVGDLGHILLELQAAMQRENLEFESISNVLKARHDAAKASIMNMK